MYDIGSVFFFRFPWRLQLIPPLLLTFSVAASADPALASYVIRGRFS
jgi:hypothetical protein